MAPPPWHATPDGQWHAKRTCRAPSTSKAGLYYWKGTFRTWPFTTEGVSFNRPICSCCVLYTHSRAAKRPHAASLPATPALGYRRCLIVFPVFRGAANDPEIDRANPSTTCALVHTECHGFRVWPSTEASQILNLSWIGAVQDHSGYPGISRPLTPQPSLEGNFTRFCRHRTDPYKYSACRSLDHLAEPDDL